MRESNLMLSPIEVVDHTVTGEKFILQPVPEGDMMETHPRPEIHDLPKYYESSEYISHTDSSRSLFEKLYQVVKKFALRQKVSLIKRYKSSGALLDLGAGTGDFLVQAKKQGFVTCGVEPGESARNRAISKGLNLETTTASLQDHSQDIITMWHVLEHVPEVGLQIDELRRILKPDGVLIVAVPNFKSFDAEHYGAFWAAYDAPRHLHHFSQTAMHRIFNEKQMRIRKVLPMYFDAFYVSLLSEKYRTGKLNYFSAFRIGLQSNLKALSSGEYSSLIYIITNK